MADSFSAQSSEYTQLRAELKALYPEIQNDMAHIHTEIASLASWNGVFNSDQATRNILTLAGNIRNDFTKASADVFTLLESYLANFESNIQFDDRAK